MPDKKKSSQHPNIQESPDDNLLESTLLKSFLDLALPVDSGQHCLRGGGGGGGRGRKNS